MPSVSGNVVNKVLKNYVAKQAPEDPLYTVTVNSKGKTKRQVRPLPEGLSKRDRKALKKIRKRAHYLDKGMNICGFRVGWTFFIGIIPGLGDAVDAGLNYCLVVKPAKKLDIPDSLLHKMLFNNAISAGIGLVPVAGDIFLAAWKANSRNALLLEAYLTIRGQEYIAGLRREPGVIDRAEAIEHGISPEELRNLFGPGAGMDHPVEDDRSNRGFFGGRKSKKDVVKK
ncbi:hypothetical protein I315_01434 [Cryptococcus gattii Ru294]|uniref:Uncharacterized protein n=2 Tax=Cryptococcus gattii TaxID=37769 RepID=E6R3H1_CRYGW|nr:Hypothetical Protein CGB_C4540W [Cryptococcus gattii WM276]KIR56369.1 hypothetical protein I315_01434 [Cryptococcus gattii Ru294]KIR81987.1 hypothetical protein I306_00858 [Cryptococcus gattii EJB2]KIY36882.1 hypothetical protein I305_00931 [Cryptococcus gattii E566]KJE03998.1 hypothetical protein I311_02129 [Cryptococcus gattii NT-10]ADV21023.1 Hypothetical Protein CGB_C4540W [Cryptococcus gattii WM276]